MGNGAPFPPLPAKKNEGVPFFKGTPFILGCLMGLEPTTTRTTIWDSAN